MCRLWGEPVRVSCGLVVVVRSVGKGRKAQVSIAAAILSAPQPTHPNPTNGTITQGAHRVARAAALEAHHAAELVRGEVRVRVVAEAVRVVRRVVRRDVVCVGGGGMMCGWASVFMMCARWWDRHLYHHATDHHTLD